MTVHLSPEIEAEICRIYKDNLNTDFFDSSLDTWTGILYDFDCYCKKELRK